MPLAAIVVETAVLRKLRLVAKPLFSSIPRLLLYEVVTPCPSCLERLRVGHKQGGAERRFPRPFPDSCVSVGKHIHHHDLLRTVHVDPAFCDVLILHDAFLVAPPGAIHVDGGPQAVAPGAGLFLGPHGHGITIGIHGQTPIEAGYAHIRDHDSISPGCCRF